MKEKQKDGR